MRVPLRGSVFFTISSIWNGSPAFAVRAHALGVVLLLSGPWSTAGFPAPRIAHRHAGMCVRPLVPARPHAPGCGANDNLARLAFRTCGGGGNALAGEIAFLLRHTILTVITCFMPILATSLLACWVSFCCQRTATCQRAPLPGSIALHVVARTFVRRNTCSTSAERSRPLDECGSTRSTRVIQSSHRGLDG